MQSPIKFLTDLHIDLFRNIYNMIELLVKKRLISRSILTKAEKK